MPKVPVRANSKSLQYEREFLNEFCANPTGDLFCNLCCQTVNCEKPFRMESHQSSAKHKKLLSTTVYTAEKRQQTFIPILKKNFKSKLVEGFLAADKPLFKLQHPQIWQLFTHLGQPVPSESSCLEHVDKLAVDEKQRLKECLHNKNTFLVVDESEINGSKYLNILIGDTAVRKTTCVLDCSIVETVNQQVVTVKINDALKKLDIHRQNFVLLLSDAARYMTACTAALKLLYPRLFHVTCMAHLLHNCAEKVCSHFQQVDNLIAKVKVVTVKNKNRRNKFNEISTPPQPVLTRWGTWLNAAEYYAKNLVKVRETVNAFEGDSILVSNTKVAVIDPNVAKLLAEIHCDYQGLPKMIQKIESSKYTIKEALTSQLST